MRNFLILFTLIFVGCLTDAFSAVRTWDGGGTDTNLATAANWVGDVPPTAFSNDDLVFPANAAQFSVTNNLGLISTFRSITIEGGSYTFGGNAVRLTNGLTVNGGGTQLINVVVNVAAVQTFTAGANSTVTLPILSVGNFPLTFDGDGLLGIGLITGSGNLTKNGSGAVLLAASANFTGAITLNNGIFAVDANMPNSSVTINGGSIGGQFGFSGFGGTGTVGATSVNVGVISAGTVTSPTGILNINNGLTFTANGNYVCKISGANPGANGHDQLNVTGTVALNNARLVPLPFGVFRPAIGDSLTILRNDGTDAIVGTFLNAPENAVFGGALNTAFRITYQGGDGNDVVITRVARSRFDYDGDGKSDVSVFRPANNTWYLNGSTTGFRGVQFGANEDKIVPADYDGDNKTDIAVFRPSNGTWYQLRSSDNVFVAQQFGSAADIPAPNDFDGDGRADLTVFRPSNGTWYQLRSITNQLFVQQFGQNGDRPVIGDFDGDGLGDLAVYRGGNWFLFESATSAFRAAQFGIATDQPVSGDFDGDGATDLAVVRSDAAQNKSDFFIRRSSDSGFNALNFGIAGDVPAVGDYDGDGKSDVAVFRIASGIWYLNRSTAGFTGVNFGQNGDLPTPGAFQR